MLAHDLRAILVPRSLLALLLRILRHPAAVLCAALPAPAESHPPSTASAAVSYCCKLLALFFRIDCFVFSNLQTLLPKQGGGRACRGACLSSAHVTSKLLSTGCYSLLLWHGVMNGGDAFVFRQQ